LLVCGGGGGGQSSEGSFVANNGGTVSTAGDFSFPGGGGVARGISPSGLVGTGTGGNAFLGVTAATRLIVGSFPGTDVSTTGFGVGGAGGRRGPSGTNRAGAPGVNGIVIVELYS
jgi:hypothetical protein